MIITTRNIKVGGNQGRGNPPCQRALRGGVWLRLAASLRKILA